MEIREPYASIITKNFSLIKENSDIGRYVQKCFSDLFSALPPKMDFQSRAKKSGDMFEYLFYYLMKHRFGIELDTNIEVKKACMVGAGAMDFGVMKESKILCGIEAKGSADSYNGKKLLRPALKRTDTMKKAISQAYQFKRIFPETPFFIVTNIVPTEGNSRCMLDLAEGDIVDKVVDITNPSDLEWFVREIKKLA